MREGGTAEERKFARRGEGQIGCAGPGSDARLVRTSSGQPTGRRREAIDLVSTHHALMTLIS